MHAPYVGRVGAPVGIFVAVDHLRRADLLTVDEEETYFDIDDWFIEHLPNPDFYDDGNSVGAVTWFRAACSADLLPRLEPLAAILASHQVACLTSSSDDPGTVVYEDRFQIGVVPYERLDPTPFPHGRPMTASTSASKRSLGKRARGRET